MPSNEGHVHWAGTPSETVTYLDQVLQIATDTLNSVKGGLSIRLSGSVLTPLSLPNSSQSSPQWDNIPGTSPALQARQDGHYPMSYIRVRQA